VLDWTVDIHELNAAAARTSSNHLVFFLPYVRLKHAQQVGGVKFVPLRDADGRASQSLESVVAIEKIVSGYVDRHGDSLTNCVVATIPGRGWDLERADFETVRWATSLLFLASWARNEYFARFGGPYVNSSQFRLVAQAYRGDMPHYISLSARRRDGGTLDGGYVHGELKFYMPVQVSLGDYAEIDDVLLTALEAASTAGSPIIDGLRTALPFVELANTDDDFMTLHNEAILMGSAFEQLLHGDASKFKLGQRFSAVFGRFGSVTVSASQKARPGIQIDTSDPTRAAAQPNWWVHQKWIEELYDLRSKVVHKGSPATRAWGWSAFEHLAMAAHVFPLMIKLQLGGEGRYALTQVDEVACLIVDKLLASPQWYDDEDGARESKDAWPRILSKTRMHLAFQKATEAFYQRHADAGGDETNPPSQE
jgi:hypothetical protein